MSRMVNFCEKRGRRRRAYVALVDDGVLLRLRLDSVDGQVSEDDGSNGALSPYLVKLNVLGGRPTPLVEVVVGPGAESLSH